MAYGSGAGHASNWGESVHASSAEATLAQIDRDSQAESIRRAGTTVERCLRTAGEGGTSPQAWARAAPPGWRALACSHTITLASTQLSAQETNA